MSDDKAYSVAKRPRPSKRRFYEIGHSFNSRPGFQVLDESVFPPYRERRLPASMPPVPYMFDKSDGRLDYDLALCFAWWLVSDRTKTVFERVDPEAFVFVPCDVRVPRGRYPGPDYWVCDVVRVLDALDESASSVSIGVQDDVRCINYGQKYYTLISDFKLAFREAAIGDAHIFRMAYNDLTVICDQELKDACKSAGLKGIRFHDTSKGLF